jgi:hypothetical protein
MRKRGAGAGGPGYVLQPTLAGHRIRVAGVAPSTPSVRALVAATANGACARTPSHLPGHPGGVRRRGMPPPPPCRHDGGRLSVRGPTDLGRRAPLAAQSSPPEGRPEVELRASRLLRQAEPGHFLSATLAEDCSANDPSQSTADVRGRPLAKAKSPWRSIKDLSCRPAAKACRPSVVRGRELALPTQYRPRSSGSGGRKPAAR